MADVNDISVLVMAVERLAEAQAKTNDKVDKLIESMGKQEVILEKLANIEKQHNDAMKRVYNQMDTHVNERKEATERLSKKLDILESYMLHDGCPAHKSFKIGYDMTKERLDTTTANHETRISEIEDAPKVAISKIMQAVFAVFGTAIGTWLLIKFGFDSK